MDHPIYITFAYAGQLAQAAGRSEETTEAKAPMPLVALLRTAAERHGEAFQKLLFDENDHLRRALIVSLDGTQVAEPDSCRLTGNHEVFLMTPIAGG